MYNSSYLKHQKLENIRQVQSKALHTLIWLILCRLLVLLQKTWAVVVSSGTKRYSNQKWFPVCSNRSESTIQRKETISVCISDLLYCHSSFIKFFWKRWNSGSFYLHSHSYWHRINAPLLSSCSKTCKLFASLCTPIFCVVLPKRTFSGISSTAITLWTNIVFHVYTSFWVASQNLYTILALPILQLDASSLQIDNTFKPEPVSHPR